ncbi:Hypothetical predicted protein [Pelobates cultripes]|uniref:Uncharacterized protein n=1 Tax=Pelobates cultripes TaxID=61616 RepID=A0AAD1RH67_PELCU|nr:Hypothetical predicted protein [Pelobates cultripes]
MVVRRVPVGRPHVEEVVDGVTAQPRERAIKRGWRCRLLVREPNLILPNVREANVVVCEPADGLQLPNVREMNMEVGELANGRQLLNVRELNVEVPSLPAVRLLNGEAGKLQNVRFLCLLLQGMKEKRLQVIGVLERGLDKHGPAEEG